MTRKFSVAGIPFEVSLESPWKFMPYSAPVQQRIRKAAQGAVMDILPTRAGDDVPSRTYVTCREDLPENFDRSMLDFSQYEPFATEEDAEPVFRVNVKGTWPDLVSDPSNELLFSIDDVEPYYKAFRTSGGTLFVFRTADDVPVSAIMVSQDAKVGDFYVNGLKRPSSVVFYLCMCLRIMFSYNAAAHEALLLHASVISHNSASTLFLGASGTGKSTHSRLWLDHIAGAELVNDDNPVVRLEDGHWSVYGTPWSGKTPCYRNVKEPVRAFVRLSQAPENHIERVKGIAAYAAFVGSVSTVRWDKSVMDSMTALASDIAQNVPTYKMGCLPNAEAAEICCSEVEKQ